MTSYVYSVFRKDILEFITEIEICISQLELSPSSGTATEGDWASLLLDLHGELGELDASLLSPVARSFCDQASTSRST